MEEIFNSSTKQSEIDDYDSHESHLSNIFNHLNKMKSDCQNIYATKYLYFNLIKKMEDADQRKFGLGANNVLARESWPGYNQSFGLIVPLLKLQKRERRHTTHLKIFVKPTIFKKPSASAGASGVFRELWDNNINKYGSANANNPFKSASILFTHTIN